MSYTDRQYLKLQQAGALGTTGAANAVTAIAQAHCRHFAVPKTGTENAATNVAETQLAVINRKAQFSNGSQGTIKYVTGTNVAANATNYAVITVQKRTSGGAAVTVASWNTHPSAQGAITQYTPASLSVVANADATITAGDALSYTIGKLGSGVLIDTGVFQVDPEEV